MIHTDKLSKQYGTFTALRDCSVDISRGEIVGLLGPNGAGKTTFIRILLGFLHPSSGSAQIAGWDCTQQSLQARRHISYVPGNVRLMGRMRVRECLAFLAGLRHPNRRAEAWRIADRLELPLHTRIAYLSTGMRQKLALCAALSASVPVMILDEPTANLDPSVRQEVLQLVREAQRGGQTVIFSSHVLSEVEEICERVILLRAGELVHTQSMSELRRGHRIRARGAGFPGNLPEDLAGSTTVEIDRDAWVQINAWGALSPVLQWIAPFNLDEIYVEPMGLRDVYEQFFPSGHLQPCGRQ